MKLKKSMLLDKTRLKVNSGKYKKLISAQNVHDFYFSGHISSFHIAIWYTQKLTIFFIWQQNTF